MGGSQCKGGGSGGGVSGGIGIVGCSTPRGGLLRGLARAVARVVAVAMAREVAVAMAMTVVVMLRWQGQWW